MLEKSQVILKYIAIISLICLAPFLSVDLWESSRLHQIPTEKSYIDLNLRLGGGGKSPPVIVLTKNGKRVFVSSCDGLKELVCREEYSGESTFVSVADVIEMYPGKGIIKRIDMSDKRGKIISVTNQYADAWSKSYPTNPYQRNWFLLMVAVGTVVAYVFLKMLSIIINMRKDD